MNQESFDVKTTQTELTLPSRGYLYGESVPGGKVRISAMTTLEEKVLAGAGDKPDFKLDTIFNRCVKFTDEKFRAEELLISDRFYLLIFIRSLSYGPEYGYKVKCPDCGSKFRKEISLLTDLECKHWPEDKPVTEPFSVTLPITEDIVEFRLLRGSDERAIAKYTKKRFETVNEIGDPAYIQRMARHIVSVNGSEMSLINSQPYVEKMQGRDSQKFRRAVEDADCGIQLEREEECRNCGSDIEQILPFTVEFFRPR